VGLFRISVHEIRSLCLFVLRSTSVEKAKKSQPF
jgi:hypothetical protein